MHTGVHPHECARVACGAANPFVVPQTAHIHHAANLQWGRGFFLHQKIQESRAVHVVAACATWNWSLASQSHVPTSSQAPCAQTASAEVPAGPQDLGQGCWGQVRCLLPPYPIQGNLPQARVHMQEHAWGQVAAAQISSAAICPQGNSHSHSWGCALE